MKIGIVVYSWSGNTLSVAGKLREHLIGAGHSVELLPITVAGTRERGARKFELGPLPDLDSYEGVVFGGAVEAFSLTPVLSAYLEQMAPLAGKKVACLVTQQFPYPWMGGSRAIRQMKKICMRKGGTIVGAAVVNWAASRREKTASAAIESLGRAF